MTAPLELLIDALRQELQQYGEMLALLDRQQDFVVARAANDLLDSIGEINAQSGVIQAVRRDREKAQSTLALALALPGDSQFAQIIPSVPRDYQPLLSALVDENNELLVRIQQRARQNHILLTRSLELMMKLISSLVPAVRADVYTGSGVKGVPSIPVQALYEAVG